MLTAAEPDPLPAIGFQGLKLKLDVTGGVKVEAAAKDFTAEIGALSATQKATL